VGFSHHKPSLTTTAQELLDRRNMLRAKAKRGSASAARKLKAEFSMVVLSEEQIEQFVKERPELLEKDLKGKTWFDTRQANR
jgi:hypothetical protein